MLKQNVQCIPNYMSMNNVVHTFFPIYIDLGLFPQISTDYCHLHITFPFSNQTLSARGIICRTIIVHFLYSVPLISAMSTLKPTFCLAFSKEGRGEKTPYLIWILLLLLLFFFPLAGLSIYNLCSLDQSSCFGDSWKLNQRKCYKDRCR